MTQPFVFSRVDLSQAVITVLEMLKYNSSISISGIAKATGIDRRTIGKAINLILEVQASLNTQRIEKVKMGKAWAIKFVGGTSKLITSAKRTVLRRGE